MKNEPGLVYKRKYKMNNDYSNNNSNNKESV